MRTTLLIFALAALALAPPFAAAGPITDGCHASLVCITESNYGSCPDEGFEAHSTSISVGGEATLTGYSYCYGSGGEAGLAVSTAAGGAGYGEVWYSDPENGDFHGCWVYGPALYQNTPCLPNPGWGALLP